MDYYYYCLGLSIYIGKLLRTIRPALWDILPQESLQPNPRDEPLPGESHPCRSGESTGVSPSRSFHPPPGPRLELDCLTTEYRPYVRPLEGAQVIKISLHSEWMDEVHLVLVVLWCCCILYFSLLNKLLRKRTPTLGYYWVMIRSSLAGQMDYCIAGSPDTDTDTSNEKQWSTAWWLDYCLASLNYDLSIPAIAGWLTNHLPD